MRAFSLALLAALGATPATESLAADMPLRDALYLYSQPIHSKSKIQLIGYHCDVFELALDVDSGYADIEMTEGTTAFKYPDRIVAAADMFAYALYHDVPLKRFSLSDKNLPAADTVIGTATAFGYCYSTKADAAVFKYDGLTNTCRNSRGTVVACP